MILSDIIASEDVDKLQAIVPPPKSAASPSAPEVGVEWNILKTGGKNWDHCFQIGRFTLLFVFLRFNLVGKTNHPSDFQDESCGILCLFPAFSFFFLVDFCSRQAEQLIY